METVFAWPSEVPYTHSGWFYITGWECYVHFLFGEIHKLDGPAITHRGGQEWFLDGKSYSYKEWIFHPKVIETKLQNIMRDENI